MDAKAVANAAYVLQRAEANLLKLTEKAKENVAAAVKAATDKAEANQSAKLAAATTKVQEAKAKLSELTKG